MVTEFCDTRDDKGNYRKYSAFRVDDDIIPRHIISVKDWVQKRDMEGSSEFLEDELDCVANNPHKKTLEEIFNIACIDYGRIDYSMKNGNIQI